MTHHPIVDRLAAAWNSQRAADVLALMHADAVLFHPLAGPDPLRGREAIAGLEQPMFSAFSAIEWQAVDSFHAGDRVAVAWTVTATNTGTLPTPKGPVPPTGKRVRIVATSLYRLGPDGAIVEERRMFDAAGFMVQLGLAG